MNSAFVIWRDPVTTMWEPVAKLTEDNGVYTFAYTVGALTKGFVPFPRMDLLTKEYVSSQLFPFFQNRLIPERRPEYYTMLSWLDMVPKSNDPLEILGVSGGAKKTDSFRIVKVPEKTADNEYRLKFFVSGSAYISDNAKHELLALSCGQELCCFVEASNKADANALSISVSKGSSMFGYYPHYLNQDLLLINAILGVDGPQLLTRIKVLKVNYSAPEQYRLLCESITPWPEGFVPFQSEKYKSLVY
ncbi:hypothetical protein [Pseudomonas syringae]|uniref:hypothetical protein n=1 Tax=Pseudomonas syringae TaxID=317 RepID=UPI000ACADBFB|nr:hypothetical protein [Pseudomonas syringae]